MVKVIWHKAASPPHTGGANVHPIYSKPKIVAMASFLSCRVSAISAFCWPTTHPPITNRLVAVVYTKPVTAALVPKLIAMAATLRLWISAMSSSDSLTPKSTPRIKQRVASLYNQSYSPSKAKKCLSWQRSLGAGYRQYLHFVGRPLKPPP